MAILSRKQTLLIGFAVVVLLIIAGLFVFGLKAERTVEKVTLNVWGTEDEDAFAEVSREYSKLKTNVTINYTQFGESEYETQLIKALAAGQGPDILFIRSRSLPVELLSPVPATQFTLEQVRELFPRVIEQDFSVEGEIYALPLYLDTLALVYNKDIFDRSGIINPPQTWEELEDMVSDLRSLDEQGRVKKAGAALGGSSRSINNASDILQMIMLQNGTQMIDENGKLIFSDGNRGVNAFEFYTKFADPLSPYYTWDDTGRNSMDSFAAGDTVMMFSYLKEINLLKEKNPFLNMGIAPVPQINKENPVVMANYYGLAVSKQSQSAEWAWDFIINVSTNEDLQNVYLKASDEPPALRSIIAKRTKDAEYGVFARQALVARSWYYGSVSEVNAAFSQAIQKVVSGAANSKTALLQAQNQISLVLR